MNLERISIKVIPHEEQRYDTVGDYRELHGVCRLTISDVGDWRHQFCVAVHELVEAFLCKYRSIPWSQIDRFDLAYEQDEPGDDPEAPYFNEHQFALRIERMLANEFGIDWHDYEAVFPMCRGTLWKFPS